MKRRKHEIIKILLRPKTNYPSVLLHLASKHLIPLLVKANASPIFPGITFLLRSVFSLPLQSSFPSISWLDKGDDLFLRPLIADNCAQASGHPAACWKYVAATSTHPISHTWMQLSKRKGRFQQLSCGDQILIA